MQSNDALIISKATTGVTTVTLNRPSSRNALSRALIGELAKAFTELSSDDGTRVVVLDHAGPVFCAGADLKESAAARDLGDLPAAALPSLFLAMDECPKPIVVVARGGVRGGGMGLLAAADLAVVAEDAKLAFSEVRLGVVPAVIGPVVAQRLTPARTRELFLTGETFTGQDAAYFGLADIAAPSEDVEEALHTAVGLLLQGGPSAQAGIKEITRHPHLSSELAQAAETTARYFLSEEGQEGVAAFTEKRRPSWVI
ncbi:enoyl-CoA hydratase/isomerase family protein [Salininema proteolyticum]|uniref:Enoyl-CoA hydratase/isomerase family protein n=1 Tax=Salininema proteolyticum TaxID=1607685 RepID=A0ABV8TVN6_9ACTN